MLLSTSSPPSQSSSLNTQSALCDPPLSLFPKHLLLFLYFVEKIVSSFYIWNQFRRLVSPPTSRIQQLLRGGVEGNDWVSLRDAKTFEWQSLLVMLFAHVCVSELIQNAAAAREVQEGLILRSGQRKRTLAPSLSSSY